MRKIRSAVTVGVASLSFLGLLVVAPAAEAAPCSAVTIIGVRGSGEPSEYKEYRDKFEPDTGLVVGPLVERIKSAYRAKSPGSAEPAVIGLKYRAASVSVLKPTKAQIVGLASPYPAIKAAASESYRRGNLGAFTSSINGGVALLKRTISGVASNCPESKIVLIGYSQGAMVVHQASLQLAISDPQFTYRHVWTTVMVADGDRVRNTQTSELGSASNDSEGVRSAFRVGESDSPVFEGGSYSVCNTNDLVCDWRLRDQLVGSPLAVRARFDQAEKIHTDSYRERTLLDYVAAVVARNL